MLSLRFINEKLKSKHRSSIYFFVRLAKINLKKLKRICGGYYGSKSKIVNKYPEPEYGKKIIEPFAGTAQYSLKYWDRDIVLIEIRCYCKIVEMVTAMLKRRYFRITKIETR